VNLSGKITCLFVHHLLQIQYKSVYITYQTRATTIYGKVILTSTMKTTRKDYNDTNGLPKERNSESKNIEENKEPSILKQFTT
jgi:hypothetical protein